MTDVCLGLGPAAGASFGGLGGVAFTDTAEDLLGASVLFDVDIAAAVGVGISAGTTVPGGVAKLLFTLTSGAAAGIGASICVTSELDVFELV